MGCGGTRRIRQIKRIEDLKGKKIATELVGFTKRYLKKNRG